MSAKKNLKSSKHDATDISPSSSLPYMLFEYREKMRHAGTASQLKKSKSKLYLTEKLIAHTKPNVSYYCVEELLKLNRLKRELRASIKTINDVKSLGFDESDIPSFLKMGEHGRTEL